MTVALDLSKAPNLLRGPIATGLGNGKQSIDRDGGDHSAGVIRAAAVITRGEALGHGMWIDATMLQQTHDAIATAKNGVKARFTHPGLSSDGLGSFLGRFKNPKLDGDVVRADLHLSKSAHDTPDGDLADYVATLAEEDPQAFGTSIVFRRDRDGENDFKQQNQKEVEVDDGNGRTSKRKRFRSPDPLNTQHLPHARLASLRAVDAVDSPAANPSGFFHATDIAHDAESLIGYALGVSSERPELTGFDVEPDRVQGFVAKFLDRHGLELKPKTQEAPIVSKISPETSAANPQSPIPNSSPADPRAEFAAQLQAYVAEFGAANGSQWASEAKPLDECRTLHAASIAQQRAAELAAKDATITTLTAERDSLQLRIDQAQLGEAKPVEFAPEGGAKKPLRFSGLPDGAARFAAGLKLAERN